MLTRTYFRVDPFVRMVEEMDRIFGGMNTAGLPSPAACGPCNTATFPLLNIWQDERAMYAEAELPGFSMGSLEILASGDTLTIKGKREIAHPEGAKVVRAERSARSFERTLTLPAQVDVERIEATLANGVLTITLPKAQAVLPRKIEVKTR
jgi:HSP20 family protein